VRACVRARARSVQILRGTLARLGLGRPGSGGRTVTGTARAHPSLHPRIRLRAGPGPGLSSAPVCPAAHRDCRPRGDSEGDSAGRRRANCSTRYQGRARSRLVGPRAGPGTQPNHAASDRGGRRPARPAWDPFSSAPFKLRLGLLLVRVAADRRGPVAP
jgi:hypothetical protein